MTTPIIIPDYMEEQVSRPYSIWELDIPLQAEDQNYNHLDQILDQDFTMPA